MTTTKLAYTIREAAMATGLGRSTLYKEIKLGRLAKARLAGRTVVLASELRRFVEEARHG
jgi:excisionase family DNA binding protein